MGRPGLCGCAGGVGAGREVGGRRWHFSGAEEEFGEGDLVIPIIESIEMLSSSKDLCLIFIKAAEAEGVLGGAAAGEGLTTEDRQGQDHTEATFPVTTTAVTVTCHRDPGEAPAMR